MVVYLDRLKKGVIVTPYGLYKYPYLDLLKTIDTNDHNICEFVISFEGAEACYYDYPLIVLGVDEI
jgi:hypothetical protein